MCFGALQVLGLPFVFIPISTLNYVGVPRDKNNQISSFSNFARNLGGSAGTAMLTTFSAADRSRPTRRPGRACRSWHRRLFILHGRNQRRPDEARHSADAAAQMATGQAYQIMLRQASMLSYQNAFTILGASSWCSCRRCRS